MADFEMKSQDAPELEIGLELGPIELDLTDSE
jgi:hypothetical protein